jgi:hypothetical protein
MRDKLFGVRGAATTGVLPALFAAPPDRGKELRDARGLRLAAIDTPDWMANLANIS